MSDEVADDWFPFRTVGQLRELLSKLDDDLEIAVCYDSGFGVSREPELGVDGPLVWIAI